MVKYLFVAEKPSLAGEIANARAEQMGVSASKGKTHWTVGDDAVTWLFGHMYETAPPQAYDPRYEKWNLNDLPIIPENWKLQISSDKKDHVKSIAGLIKQAEYLVNAGDAAREGQLLVDEVLLENGWNPFDNNTYRLWVRSVARKDMLDALSSMELNSTKEDLYQAAIGRQRADWLHGMNMSRLYTVKAQQAGSRGVVSVGRVQTPTLKLVVDRDREIENFKPVNHFVPTGLFVHENGKFNANFIIPEDMDGLDSEGRLISQEEAKKVVDRINGKTGSVYDYKTSDKSKAPPLPYSLSALQTECSAKLGLSAQETLDVAQVLYERYKVTTYPRSDSRYLPTAILKDEAPQIVANLKSVDGTLGSSAENAKMTLKSAAWNDSKISDHHGIIPTTEAKASKIASLNRIERQVFDIITKAFLAQFFPAQRYKSINAIIDVEGDRFKANGRLPVDDGWRYVYDGEKDEDENDEDNQSLPSMKKGDPVEVEKSSNSAKQTKPPARFSDGTLIAAMSNIHKFVTDPESKKKLKENEGLGTEATRANMIETLIKRNFLMRKGKKQLISTDTGRSVIDALPDEITDPVQTAVWEGQLDGVSGGTFSLEAFMAKQVEVLKDRIEVGKNAEVRIKDKNRIRPIDGDGDTCPKCEKGKLRTREVGKGKHKGKKFLSCDQYPDCDHTQWPQPKIKPIEGHGEKCPKCSEGELLTREVMKGEHKGKKFLSCSKYPDCNHSQWPQPKVTPVEGHGEKCPKCDDGEMLTRMVGKGEHKGKKFLSCSNYPECGYSSWPKAKVDPIEGDGKTCEKCNKGTMVTRVVGKGEHKGKKFLSCSDYPNCNAVEWPKVKLKPIEGDGKQCPQCSDGKMVTRKSKTGKMFLSCDQYPKCNAVEWPKEAPIKGDGETCSKCNKGTMVTRVVGKGDNKGKKFLSCNAYPDCDNTVWPDSKTGKKSGSKKK